jgi:hypothetical protein
MNPELAVVERALLDATCVEDVFGGLFGTRPEQKKQQKTKPKPNASPW